MSKRTSTNSCVALLCAMCNRVLLRRELYPVAVLLLPVVLRYRVQAPNPVLQLPVFNTSDAYPTPVLQPPVTLHLRVACPIPTFLPPVVFVNKVQVPIAIL